MTASSRDYKDIFDNWNVDAEQSKADFLDKLYEFYGCSDGLYTGLFQRFQADLVDYARHLVTTRNLEVADLFRTALEL
jgi:hypothetical protein